MKILILLTTILLLTFNTTLAQMKQPSEEAIKLEELIPTTEAFFKDAVVFGAHEGIGDEVDRIYRKTFAYKQATFEVQVTIGDYYWVNAYEKGATKIEVSFFRNGEKEAFFPLNIDSPTGVVSSQISYNKYSMMILDKKIEELYFKKLNLEFWITAIK